MTRIVTLTLNPAVDLAWDAPHVQHTRKIRTTNEHYDPGGGGLNVARVVHALGGDATAIFLAGDSFVAGMTLGLARGLPPEAALAYGIATGTSAVAHIGTARPDPEQVEALFAGIVANTA